MKSLNMKILEKGERDNMCYTEEARQFKIFWIVITIK